MLVDVAQLVEHLVVIQDVAGSSPVVHPLLNDQTTQMGRFFMGISFGRQKVVVQIRYDHQTTSKTLK